MKRKIISLLLCLVMALSLIPTVAFGVDAGVTPTNVDIPVEKVWSGDENHSDQRPQSITVRLLDANNEPVGEPIILEANKSWKGTLTVPSEGTFTIQEVNVPEGYTSTVTQQPIVGNITLGTWSQKHTPASQPNLSLDGYNMFVAKKGDELYIWCAFELTGSQRIQLINHLKEVAPSELKPVKEDKTTTTTTGAGCGFSISNNSVTFDNPNDWSLVYLNNISFNVTNAKITNTYEKDTPTLTGSLKIIKDFEGLPVGTTPDSVSFTVTGPNSYNQTVTMTANDQWTKTLTGLTPGEYTVTENEESAKVEGYVLTAPAAQTATVTLGNTATSFLFTNTYAEESTPPAEDVPVNIPVTKNVTISRGSKEPVATPFTFEAYVGNQKVGELKLTPKSADKWTATDNLTVSIPYNLFDNGVATVTIKEIPGGDTRWKYDTKEYKVLVYENGTYTVNPQIAARATADQAQEPTALTFTNEYNYKYTPTPRPTTPAKPVTSVKTGDMGVALYAGLAILSMTGSAGVILRRRKNDK